MGDSASKGITRRGFSALTAGGVVAAMVSPARAMTAGRPTPAVDLVLADDRFSDAVAFADAARAAGAAVLPTGGDLGALWFGGLRDRLGSGVCGELTRARIFGSGHCPSRVTLNSIQGPVLSSAGAPGPDDPSQEWMLNPVQHDGGTDGTPERQLSTIPGIRRLAGMSRHSDFWIMRHLAAEKGMTLRFHAEHDFRGRTVLTHRLPEAAEDLREKLTVEAGHWATHVAQHVAASTADHAPKPLVDVASTTPAAADHPGILVTWVFA